MFKFCRSLFSRHYTLDMLHWSKSLISWNSFWSSFFDRDDTMDTLLDTTKVFLSSVCFLLLPTDDAWDSIFFFCSCLVIPLAYYFRKMAPITAIMDAIYLWFSAMDNDLLHASVHSLSNKTEVRITFDLSHAHLYLSESDDEWDDKSSAANRIDISCGGGGYIYLL